MLDTPRRSSPQGYSLPQILDRTFRIYRQNFLPFFVLSAIVQIPLLIISSLITQQQQQSLASLGFTGSSTALSVNDAQSLLGPLIGIYVSLIVIAVISGLATGILVYGPIVFTASENHLGRSATLSEGLAAVGNRLQSLATGLILFYAILLIMGIALAFALFLCGLGLGLLLYVGLALGSLLIPVLVLERTDIRTALGRAWTLGKTRVWVLLAITVGLNIVIFLVDLALTAAFTALFRNNTSPVVDILIAILGSIGGLVLLPLLPIAFTEVYYDLRNRFEGLDIALKSATAPNASPADVPSPAPGRLVGNEDYLNIALFAIGTLVIILVLYFGIVSLLGPRVFGL